MSETHQVRALVARVMNENGIAYEYSVKLTRSPYSGLRDLRVVTVRGVPKDVSLRAKLYDGILAAVSPIKARVDIMA